MIGFSLPPGVGSGDHPLISLISVVFSMVFDRLLIDTLVFVVFSFSLLIFNEIPEGFHWENDQDHSRLILSWLSMKFFKVFIEKTEVAMMNQSKNKNKGATLVLFICWFPKGDYPLLF